jgi:hypothetical protein
VLRNTAIPSHELKTALTYLHDPSSKQPHKIAMYSARHELRLH